MTSDKGGLSAELLRKRMRGCWRSVQRMLDKLRAAMADRNADYPLQERVEVDDCLIDGANEGGKRERGSETKRPALRAVGSTDQGRGGGPATFMKAQAVGPADYT